MISPCGTPHSSVSSSGLGSGRGYGAVISPPLQQGTHIGIHAWPALTEKMLVELPSTPHCLQIIVYGFHLK